MKTFTEEQIKEAMYAMATKCFEEKTEVADIPKWINNWISQHSANMPVSGQLLAFLRWIKDNKHRYMLTDETKFVDEFLKASNLRFG